MGIMEPPPVGPSRSQQKQPVEQVKANEARRVIEGSETQFPGDDDTPRGSFTWETDSTNNEPAAADGEARPEAASDSPDQHRMERGDAEDHPDGGLPG